MTQRKFFGAGVSPGRAVITGASSGIGAEFARQLAARGHSLLLVARRRDRLEALAAELRASAKVDVMITTADLARGDEIERLSDELRRRDDIDIVINNAGFGMMGMFAEMDMEPQMDMIQVHAAAPVLLTRAVLPGMLRRKRGAVVFTSSVSAFVPSPRVGLYGPTKAFLVSLAELLAIEFAGTGVRVQALCPGFTHTEFHDNAELSAMKTELPKFFWGTVSGVVSASLRGIERGRVIVVPGLVNKLYLGLAPRWLKARIAASSTKGK